jgi:hypothetical protein
MPDLVARQPCPAPSTRSSSVSPTFQCCARSTYSGASHARTNGAGVC